ncbi:MAG TPA: ROK family protein [Myxococcota bacterium]|nr:ROK family protein [Myxococcota bacterium]
MWLGIDVGGSKLALALADGANAPLRASRRQAWTPSGDAARDVALLVAEARRLLDGEGGAALRALGVCAPGPLDSQAGIVHGPPNLPGWRDVPLVSWLEREFGCAVALENDANAAALAEWQARTPRPASLVYLTLSTGVGAGLVLDGRLYRGAHDLAGEVGHAPIVWDGELCACGLRGCLEAYVGGAAWTRRLRAIAPDTGRVAALAGGPGAVRPEHVVLAAREGDAFARAELERWNEHLSHALVAIAFAYAPEVISLGTIASAAGEALCLAPLRSRLAARVWPRLAGAVRLELRALGEDLPFRAALAVAERAASERQGR